MFRATELRHGRPDRESTEADMAARRFPIDAVQALIADSGIVDVCRVAAFRLVVERLRRGYAGLPRPA